MERRKFLKKLCLISSFILLSQYMYSAEYTLEELNKLKKRGAIGIEEYEVLKGELVKSEINKGVYSLKINGKLRTNIFRIQKKKKETYIPLMEFLNHIEFTNYERIVDEKNDVLKLLLGDSLREVYFDLKNKKILTPTDEIKERIFNGWIYIENEELYMSSSLFKDLFLDYLDIDDKDYSIKGSLNFLTPEEIKNMMALEREKAGLSSENNLVFTNKKKMFELGYARLNIDKTFDKREGEDWENDWSGNVEYQGAFLYGDLKTSYDLKEKELGNIYLEYPEIWNEHTLKVGSVRAGGDSRELELHFSKEKGFYNTQKSYVIKESVPIGSRVELIYMGFVLEVQDAVEGMVEFDNPEIKENRTYQLKVYTPDGKILMNEIQTADDYGQQNKSEVEYDIALRENKASGKVKTDVNVHYGVTDNLTAGLSYSRGVEKINGDNKYVDSVRGELIYSNYFKKLPFTIKFGGENSLNSYVDTSGKDFSKKYKYDLLGQITVKDFKFIVEQNNYGSYYDEKRENSYRIEYQPYNWLSLDYEYFTSKDYDGDGENYSTFGISASKTYKKLMTTFNYSKSSDKRDEYSLNFYYTGFEYFNTRLENKWKEDSNGDLNYEAALTLYNNSYRNSVDYTLSAGYSEKYKDKVTLSFTYKFDNWLDITGKSDKDGNQNVGIGIDRVIDLKNPTKKINSTDVSRVKVITFIDGNDNNIYDKDEPRVDNVEVNIGKEKLVTDKNGEAMFYGVPNSIVYDLKPTIRKPSFSLGDNKIKIKGKASSTIEAFIPIKPMVTLSGNIEFDRSLLSDLTKEEIQEVYSNILVRIKDEKGKEIELTMPDNTGIFEVSGLFPEVYQIEVMYIGTDYNIPTLDEMVQLAYIDEESNIKITFRMTNDLIAIKKTDGDIIGYRRLRENEKQERIGLSQTNKKDRVTLRTDEVE